MIKTHFGSSKDSSQVKGILFIFYFFHPVGIAVGCACITCIMHVYEDKQDKQRLSEAVHPEQLLTAGTASLF